MAETSITYKVKVSPELFDKGKGLRHRPLGLVSIIQNDMQISRSDLITWNKEVDKFIAEIDSWREEVLDHIENCNQ